MAWCRYVTVYCLVINGILGKISVGEDEKFLMKYEVASPDEFLTALSDSGAFVFSGLGKEYAKAVRNIRKNSPNCLHESLEVELEDGSRRLTVARDSETATDKFPNCVAEDIETVTEYFDKIDKFVMDVLENNFNTSIKTSDSNKSVELTDLPTKSHLHVYLRDLKTQKSDSALSLPFHTDNGLYLLLTPSHLLPLRIINRNGIINDLITDDDSVIFLTGSGLTSWLLPEDGLYSPPHAVPSLTNSNTLTRSVFARMRVAPLDSTTSHSVETFGEHFYSSLTGPGPSPGSGGEARHQARLRRQVGSGHAQHWIGQSSGNSSSTD